MDDLADLKAFADRTEEELPVLFQHHRLTLFGGSGVAALLRYIRELEARLEASGADTEGI